ncbi:MAG: HAD family hydrolase [Desulfobacteraceae bacterium]|nr:HAD family hydrolase [Desulfobacteraceae bacterium]
MAFDCDGVMFDSSQSNRAYYNHILENFGLPSMTDIQFAYVHMHTVDEALTYLFREAGMVMEAIQYCRRLSYAPFIREMVIEPHLREVLRRFRPRYKTAIATNRTNTMSRVLQEHHLEGLFDKVVTAADVRHAKPHPEQLQVLMAHFGISPGQMIYIGDSELDEAAAHQAGVPFMAYNNMHLKADKHIEHLGQLIELLPC